ncbi:MAG: hypothetical protein EU532_03380 [Promethearchaeota archaeon]|nr:MAG: hypothetical protein EU532_03380 [Candidatus Lokiarchaeota archaeon]
MGFKCISQTELKIKSGPNYIGVPLRFLEEIKQETEYKTTGIEISKSTDQISEISIVNNESLEFLFDHQMNLKSAEGYGTISIVNNSYKDRIWDARIEILGSNIENETNLRIFEPRTNKNIRYSIEALDDLQNPLVIHERIEILNEEIKSYKDIEQISGIDHYDSILEDGEKRYLLLFGKENLVKFTIIIENNSNSTIKNINLQKEISKHFYDIECISDSQADIKTKGNILKIELPELNPGQKRNVDITAKIFPEKKERIRTGAYNITYNIENSVISETEIINFSAYSHAKHLINVEEKETQPNHWDCSFLFANHSDFTMYLKSILITDESKSENYVDLDLTTENNKIILSPGETFTTQKWEVFNENEPKFVRKISYSLDYSIEKGTDVSIKVEDDIFEIIGFQFEKDISQKEIKSFEESELYNKIIIRNTGDVAIKGVVINEIIPEDFKPPLEISQFKLKKASGEQKLENVDLKITPPNDEPSTEHTLELILNLKENQVTQLIGINELLEISYPIKAISPDYNKAYEFPLEISCYYLKNKNQEKKEEVDYYVVRHRLSDMQKPTLKVSHKRRNLAIAKEIYPGRYDDEFAICVTVKNKSTIEIKNISITDTIPITFELISSNIKNKVTKSNKENEYVISFSVESVLPFQEKEIMYYLKNKSGKDVSFSELESYFIG